MAADAVQRARAGDIEIAYETFGRRGDPPLLLVMGLGTQMLGWPDEFCARSPTAASSSSASTTATSASRPTCTTRRLPDVGAVSRGDRSSAPYTLSDMAARHASACSTPSGSTAPTWSAPRWAG